MKMGTVTAPPYPASSVHDPNNPMYDFQIDSWEETPELFEHERAQTIHTEQRDYNNRKYREIGDCAMWNRYVAFGFHQFDDCFSFAVKWKKVEAQEDPMDKYKLIWHEYAMYLLNNEEPTNNQLYQWTHNLVLPYISQHDSDYHLASVYEIEDTIQQQLPREITNPLHTCWTDIGTKKKRTPPPSPNRTKPNSLQHTSHNSTQSTQSP